MELLYKLVNSANLYRIGGYLTAVSLVTFCLSLLLIPWLVGKLPEGYFLALLAPQGKRVHTPARLILLLLRNMLGAVLLLAGFAMLFLPGQGLITMLIGLFFVTFPGKTRLLKKMLARKGVRESLNWLRRKRHLPVFQWPPDLL